MKYYLAIKNKEMQSFAAHIDENGTYQLKWNKVLTYSGS